MTVAIFDIDGVLADLTHGLTTLAHDLWGTPIITGENQPTWNFRNALNEAQQDKVWELIHESPAFWGSLPAMLDGNDYHDMDVLDKNEVVILYLTNRPDNSKEHTQAWLEDRLMVPGELVHTRDKAAWVRSSVRDDIICAIDDAPANIMSYKDADIPVAIMDRPYNKDVWGKRVYSVSQFCEWVMMHHNKVVS